MPHALRTPSGPAVLIAVGLALAPVAVGPAVAQPRMPVSANWEALLCLGSGSEGAPGVR